VVVTKSKIASLVIATIYVIAAPVSGAPIDAIAAVCVALLLPLALIWFPDEIGGFTGYMGRGGNITTESPGCLVAAAGWFFLVGLPALLYLAWR